MSRLPNLLTTLSLGAALSLGATPASAQHGGPPPPPGAPPHEGHEAESEYPVSYVERPMTLPALTLAPELTFDVVRELPRAPGIGAPTGPAVVGMEIGAAFGILKDLEVSAIVVPLEFTQIGAAAGAAKFRYGAPILGATYRFFHNPVMEIGGRFQATIFTESGATGVQATPSVPLLFHIGKRLRIDTGVLVPITAGSVVGQNPTIIGLQVPFALAFDVIEPFHIGANTGLVFDDLAHTGDTAGIPLGVFAGYAVGHHKPIVDVDAFFRWNSLITPGAGTKVEPGFYQTGISARFYLYFGR